MAVTLCLIFALLVVFVGFLIEYWQPSAIPGPKELPYFGNILTALTTTSKEIIPRLIHFSKEYGSIFELRCCNMKYAFVSEPEIVKSLLSSSTHIMKSPFVYSFTKPMFDDGLIVSNGDKWHTRRKLLEPSFHFKILKKSLDNVTRNAQDFVYQLLASKGKPTEIEDMIYLLTLKIICVTAMGIELNTKDKQQNEYIIASKFCHDNMVYRFLRFWLYPDFIYHRTKAGKTFFKYIDKIHNFADQVIRNRKELFIAEKNGSMSKDGTKKERNVFLDNLLELDDSNPGLFTESDIREEVDTFMIAGHNPTAVTLKFLLFILANHQDVQEKVYNEQMEIFGDDDRNPMAQDLKKMVYLEMVIKETMRLYPGIPLLSRLLNEDLKIDENTVIPAGYNVVVATCLIHRSEKYWVNPEEFIPERFAPGIERHPFSFIPFSAGPRNCIGQKYAMMELKTIMSAVVRQCKIESVTTSISLEYAITLKTVEPILIKVYPRNGTRGSISKRNS